MPKEQPYIRTYMQYSLCHTLLTAYPLLHNCYPLLVHMKVFFSLWPCIILQLLQAYVSENSA